MDGLKSILSFIMTSPIQQALEIRAKIKSYVKDAKWTRKRSEVIGWAMIRLGLSRRLANEIVRAFVDLKTFKEKEVDGDIVLI